LLGSSFERGRVGLGKGRERGREREGGARGEREGGTEEEERGRNGGVGYE
jgi:hypothetical protein